MSGPRVIFKTHLWGELYRVIATSDEHNYKRLYVECRQGTNVMGEEIWVEVDDPLIVAHALGAAAYFLMLNQTEKETE